MSNRHYRQRDSRDGGKEISKEIIIETIFPRGEGGHDSLNRNGPLGNYQNE